jgi:hypothetical protein
MDIELGVGATARRNRKAACRRSQWSGCGFGKECAARMEWYTASTGRFPRLAWARAVLAKEGPLHILVDPDYTWPAEGKEDYRLVTERKKPGILEEVDRNEKKLEQFKQELSRYIRTTFTDAARVRPGSPRRSGRGNRGTNRQPWRFPTETLIPI